MNTLTLKKTLARELNDGSDAVLDPDHPFLMLGPDILISSKHGLVGVFLMNVTETRHPEDVLVRMAISRLGYPDGFKAVLMIPPGSRHQNDSDFIESMRMHFNAIFDWQSRSNLRHQLRYGIAEMPAFPSLGNLRNRAFSQAEILYSVSLDGIDDSQQTTSRSSKITWSNQFQAQAAQEGAALSWKLPIESDKQRHFRSKLYSWHDFNTASVELHPSTVVQPRLTRIGRQFFETDNVLDRGVPYRRRPALNVLFVDRLPCHRFDPHKWLRAAAFVGFTLVRRSEPDRVRNTLKKLKSNIGKIDA